ncbi:MAG: hypothetical protein BWY78_01159 [Alphaproteobacteria bacterium ADurb.Bin438]|nr:MAG: hypothetical protein BWY78_01159 [Alphaproteobacteria bacterium ADurb.Bin438]
MSDEIIKFDEKNAGKLYKFCKWLLMIVCVIYLSFSIVHILWFFSKIKNVDIMSILSLIINPVIILITVHFFYLFIKKHFQKNIIVYHSIFYSFLIFSFTILGFCYSLTGESCFLYNKPCQDFSSYFSDIVISLFVNSNWYIIIFLLSLKTISYFISRNNCYMEPTTFKGKVILILLAILTISFPLIFFLFTGVRSSILVYSYNFLYVY